MRDRVATTPPSRDAGMDLDAMITEAEADAFCQTLEQAMTVEVLLGMLSQRVANSTRSALRDMDMTVDEELLGLLFDMEPPEAKRPEATRECKEEETCSICLTPVVQGETIYDIPCKHCFHKSCLDKWLDRRKESCPMCRQKMV